MEATIPGRTAWETAQYRRDHGERAASALGLRLMADFIRADQDGPLPPPGSLICVPVPSGTDADRIAAVDAWAAQHHISAGWSEDRSRWQACMSFGPWTYMVYMIPQDRRAKAAPVARGDAPELAAVAR